jgi:hypothetical protein
MKHPSDVYPLFSSIIYLGITGALCTQGAWSAESESIIEQANSPEHVAAINRTRRIIKQFDVMHADRAIPGTNPDVLVKFKFDFVDSGTQIDSVSWDWSEGNTAPFPSKVIPGFNSVGFRKWFDEGTDIVRIFQEETKKRGLEAFYSYRINGSDNDPEYKGTIPFKEEHPGWLLESFWTTLDTPQKRYLNFSVPEVREHKLRILQEIAERYDFDGIQIDFARTPLLLPSGRQWEMRNHLTDFMRSVRRMMFRVAKKRGRPLLLSAKIPENIRGCHLDGIDIETWAGEQLVDLLILGVRSIDVDIQDFRRITTGTNIRLYPCFDDIHGSDGYVGPSIEILRGVFANWWSQGADGVCTFNWAYARQEAASAARLSIQMASERRSETYLQAYREIGAPETLEAKDKAFVVQRRGGGHSNVPSPDDWHTPRGFYFNTNAFGQLPVKLDNQAKLDALITLRVSDDLSAAANVTMRVLLSDPGARSLPEDQTIGRAKIRRYYGGWVRHNTPPSKDIVKHLQVRLNGCLLGEPEVTDGWLVFRAEAQQFATGENLVGIILKGSPGTTADDKLPPQWWVDMNDLTVAAAKTVPYRAPGNPAITVEKLEVHVEYRRP